MKMNNMPVGVTKRQNGNFFSDELSPKMHYCIFQVPSLQGVNILCSTYCEHLINQMIGVPMGY